VPAWSRAWSSLDPSVTHALIAACVGVSLIGFWALRRERYRRYFVFRPGPAPDRTAVGAVLSHFAHGDLGHLLLNLFALYVFGPRVERDLGAGPYLALYAASAAAGTALVYLLHRKDPRHATLGASGAIAGVVFAAVVLAPDMRLMLLLFPVPAPAPAFALLYLLFSSVNMGARDGVAHEAHLGGALTGLGLAGLLAPRGFDPLVREVTEMLVGL